jgi:organic radical activating enzyme
MGGCDIHCPICDADSDSVTPTSDCSVCQEAINECLAGYPKLEGETEEVENVDEEFDDG